MSAPLPQRARAWGATMLMAVRDVRRLTARRRAPLGSVWYALQRRRRPSASSPTAVFDLDGVALEARPRDWCAIEEVLLDGEYDFVASLFPDRPPARIVDLGANVGAFSARCLSLWPHASVVAVEAAADTFEVLARNRRRSPTRDWTVVRGAVCSEDGTVAFEAAEQSTGSKVVSVDGATNVVSVPAMRLRTLLERHGDGPVDLLKMDIEGAEEAVLEDVPEVLDRIGTLIVEIHPQRCDAGRVVGLLRERYAHLAYVSGRRSSKPLLVAARTPLHLPGYVDVPARPAGARG